MEPVDTLPQGKNDKPPAVRKRLSWMQLGIAAVFAAVLAGVIHYSLTYQHESAFEDERAFRVLDELVVQVRNLETARATFLKSMPPPIQVITPDCTDPDHTIQRLSPLSADTTEAYYTGYIDHLDLSSRLCAIRKQSAARDSGSPPASQSEEDSQPGAESKSATPEGHSSTMQAAPRSAPASVSELTDLADSMCQGLYAGSVVFTMSVKDDLLATVRCEDARKFVLLESLERAVRKFISQDFFDESMLTFANGMVISEFPVQSTNTSSNAVALHRAIADRLNLISAKALLHPPLTADYPPSAKPKPSPETPTSSETPASSETPTETQSNHLEPFAWTTKIAEQQYRVSVLPFNAPYGVAFTSDQKSCKKDQGGGNRKQDCDRKDPQHLFYMIGLHRIDWSRDIRHTLWPSGLWAAVLLLGLNLVAWPLISLTFGPAEESISVGRALGCLAGLILIPVLFILAAASLWSDLELQSRMRLSAKAYADMISVQLRQDLADGARILTTFRPVYSDPTIPPRCGRDPEHSIRLAPRAIPLGRCDVFSGATTQPLFGYDRQQRPVDACIVHEPLHHDRCDDVILSPSREAPVDGRWSPFRSIIAVNANGGRFGPALSPFPTMTVSTIAEIPDREYFQALKAGQGWMLVDTPESALLPMVAQRLYNRGDASKALQLAVPLCDPHDAFCGIITGDIRMYGLTSPISPPLLKFAVIDTTTGTVIFSSTDTRSLAENFFRESEQDPALLAVIKAHHKADFVGRYLGEPQRFYYTPISNVPWGVLVFYSRKELADLPFRAGSAALVCYVGLLLAVVIALGVLRWLCLLFTATCPGPLDLLKRAWPRGSLPTWYRDLSRFRPSAWAFLVLLIGMLASLSAMATVVSALAVLVAAACAGLIFKPEGKKGESRRSPAQQYSQCLFTLITAVSVIPAYALFVEFYHLQYEALIRDGLAENAAQIQSRYDAVHEELRRLLPPIPGAGKDSEASSPGAWSLALHPNTGMSDQDHDLPSVLQIQPPTGTAQPLRPRIPNLHERLVWQWTASSPEQQRRFEITTAPATSRGFGDMQCGLGEKSQRDTCIVRMSDGSQLEFQSAAQLRGALGASTFEWKWLRRSAIFAAVIFAAMATQFLCWLVTTRLVGLTDKLQRLWKVQPYTATPERSFQEKWQALSQAEQLALYQIARRELINPRSFAVLETPMREGLIRLDPWPVLASPDLKDSILHAESESDFERWQREAGDSAWRTIRGPLFIVIMVVIAWLSWTAGGSMKALMAVLVATAAFFGQIAQLVNFARGGAPAAKDAA